MGEEVVKLFGVRRSPYSCRIELALKLKGIQYEYIEENLSDKSPLLLKFNPVHKKVPVLLHNGNPIAESLVILEYIDDAWKNNPILPQDPYDKAMARFWAKFIDDKIISVGWKAYQGEGNEQDQAVEEVYQLFKTLENELKGKEFFGGDTVGYLDIVAGVLHWFGVVEEIKGFELFTKEKFPILYIWIARLPEIDIFKECLPPKEEHLAHLRARFEALKASK